MTAPPASRLFIAFSDCALKERLSARLCSSYGRWLGGFRTLELRSGGKRGGFEVEALGGARALFASRELVSPVSFNKYALDLGALERTALPALEAAASSGKVLYFDELGPMAMKSERFSARCVELLFSGAPCLVFFRRGAAVFEKAFRRMDGSLNVELSEAGWAEAVRDSEAWLDARAAMMRNEE
ncbi:MAG: hypothetical protein M0025_10005 [Elusimicrobia bacterium]|nr:hypothetical protein [Elusimicrobiota bacterium]